MEHILPWFQSDDEPHTRIFQEVHELSSYFLDYEQFLLKMQQVYGGSDSFTINSELLEDPPEMRHNVLAGAVDTVVSEVIQTHRRPVVMSRGGNYKDRFRCKKITQALDIYREDNQDAIAHAARDAVLTGTGYVFVSEKDEEVDISRLWPGNVLYDDRSCIDTAPRTLNVRRFIDKYVLIAKYPELEEEILRAPKINPAYAWVVPENNLDIIEVIETWHLPSSKNNKDGRHVICIATCTLLDEQYKKTYYPVVFIRPVPPMMGFRGISIAERARPAQEELDKWVLRVSQGLHLLSTPRVYLPQGPGAIPPAQITNNVGAIIRYNPALGEPKFYSPTVMSDEVYNNIDRLERYIYGTIGVSQMAAQSRKEVGLDSGSAIRANADVQSRRFIQLEKSVARATVDIARLCIDALREIGGDATVVFGNKRSLRYCTWKDIDISEDAMKITLSISNALPVDFSGRIQILAEMNKNGAMDRYDMWSTVDNPDFEAVRDRYCATKELFLTIFENSLETGEFEPVDWSMAWDTVGIQTCLEILNQALLNGATEEDVTPLRTWLEQAKGGPPQDPPPPPQPMTPQVVGPLGGPLPPAPIPQQPMPMPPQMPVPQGMPQ